MTLVNWQRSLLLFLLIWFTPSVPSIHYFLSIFLCHTLETQELIRQGASLKVLGVCCNMQNNADGRIQTRMKANMEISAEVHSPAWNWELVVLKDKLGAEGQQEFPQTQSWPICVWLFTLNMFHRVLLRSPQSSPPVLSVEVKGGTWASWLKIAGHSHFHCVIKDSFVGLLAFLLLSESA